LADSMGIPVFNLARDEHFYRLTKALREFEKDKTK